MDLQAIVLTLFLMKNLKALKKRDKGPGDTMPKPLG